MALEGVNNINGKKQEVYEDFETYADKLNKTVPERTSTIEEKERAIEAKKKIMAHPGCYPDTKVELQKEISIIEGEIERIKQEKAMNTSIFGKKTNLG